jgi:conjugal transfer pilin signal peptidase TrbI
VGFARSRTLGGTVLEAIEPGVIPANRFYVQGTHEMSFDSRYRVNGLVRRDQIIGKATVIF